MINPFVKPKVLPPMSDAECRHILDSVGGEFRISLLIGFNTGISLQELLTLRWSDCSFSDRVIVILKKDSQRDVILPIKIMSLLQEYKNGKSNNAQLIFSFSIRDYQRRLERAGAAAGISLTWQRIRSTYAANAAKAGIPILIAARSMGTSPNGIVHYWRLSLEQSRELIQDSLVKV